MNNCSGSVGTLIKNKAVTLRSNYYSLDSGGKAIVTLGLNSILDLGFRYPAAQAELLKKNQRQELNALFPPKRYPVDSYDYIKEYCHHSIAVTTNTRAKRQTGQISSRN